jgi:HEAT repeat protein
LILITGERLKAGDIIARLNGRNRIEAFEAAKKIWNIDGNALAKQLIQVLRSGRKPFNRAAAAYAMPSVSTPATIAALERTLRSETEAPDVRGHAAEALAHGHRKSTHALMRRYLKDSSKNVRFWCAFALGQMEDFSAIPDLKQLLQDKREVRGFHSVADEAADAIKLIEQRKSGRACPYCVRKRSH